MNATLSKPVDASKNKPGDEVSAVSSDDMKSNGQVVVPKGSKLFGHVTSARPRDGKAPSSSGGSSGAAGSGPPPASGSAAGSAASELGIVFDKAVLKDGREVPLHAAIQAIAAGEAAASSDLGAGDLGMSGAGSAMGAGRVSRGGGLLGGVGGTLGAATSATAGLGGAASSTLGGSAAGVGQSAGAVGGLNSAGRLTSGSHGVFGMKGLDVTSAASGSGEGSLVTSGTRTVRLEKGTRMLLSTQSGAEGHAGSASGAHGVTGAATATGNAAGAGSVNQGSGSGSATGAANGAVNATGNAGRAAPAKDGTDATRTPHEGGRDPDRR